MPKLPFMQFYPSDWLLDTRCLTPEEKGIWIDLICFMWMKDKRGIISGQVQDLARMVGREYEEFANAILKMRNKGILVLKIENSNEKYPEMTIICRRMVREQKSYINSTFRMERFKKANDKRNKNAKTTAKKSEVIHQKSEVIKDSIADTTPQTNGIILYPKENGETKKPLTDIQKVVLVYKMATGYLKDDKSWDEAHFARCAKPAKVLIDFMGRWEDAADCIQEIYERLTSKGLTVTLETIVKHSAEWKKNYLEKHPVVG